MQTLEDLISKLTNVTDVLWDLVAFILHDGLLPILPLVAWILFWLFAVNWTQLRETLLNGAWIGLLLIGFAAVVSWCAIAPPAAGTHDILGLSVSNFVGKTVYVTMLFSIMFLCGAVQLSGCCQSAVTSDGSAADAA